MRDIEEWRAPSVPHPTQLWGQRAISAHEVVGFLFFFQKTYHFSQSGSFFEKTYHFSRWSAHEVVSRFLDVPLFTKW